jgi:hypothetical protein
MSQDNEPELLREGTLDMQVCVPKYYTDKQVIAFTETQRPCGTTHGWAIRREGDKALKGDPERCQCEERSNYVHVMLDA